MAAALITGASSGIGEQFAYALARERYALALTARREDRLQAVAAQAQKLGAPATHIFVLDLARPSAPAELYGEVTSAGLELDLLVNNAGFGTHGRFDHLALERELEQIDLNIRALVALTRLLLPGMIAARRGTIINVASSAGFQAVPYMATYAATKSFVVNFSLALHQELRETGVHVMALCPGATRTEFQSVAGTDGTMPSFVYMDAKTVVAQALRAARAGRAMRINGALNIMATEAQRIAPRTLVARIAGMFFRPSPRN
jgi:short-subunit dehydrogenase